MSILSDFKNALESTLAFNVYFEYDTTPLKSRGNIFATVGIKNDEHSTDIKNSQDNFSKNRVSFIVRLIMSKNTNADVIENFFDNYILNSIMQSSDFNIISVEKDTPHYTKYLDKMELSSNIIVECITHFD